MMLWPNGGGEARIEIDDFEVQGALAIPDKTSLATTWAQLKL
jgi:hypothetical protein